jgi:hypothetical protein
MMPASAATVMMQINQADLERAAEKARRRAESGRPRRFSRSGVRFSRARTAQPQSVPVDVTA